MALYERCRLCPRACGVNRNAGERGRCGMAGGIYAARAALHMWEEPCISGTRGSGTVFFSGCSLGCLYCQNREIAGGRRGKEITVSRLADIFLELQDAGAANVNLVTPTHYLPSVLEALNLARSRGLSVPAVYNCGGYESVWALKLLDGLIDVYLTDFKYMEADTARTYSGAEDYPARAAEALEEMARQAGEASFNGEGMMKKGVIVRHLLLPGHVRNGKAVVKYVYEHYQDRVWLSLMNQYTPPACGSFLQDCPELGRRVTKREYEALVQYALELGVENAFIQEGKTAKESFVPAFDGRGITAPAPPPSCRWQKKEDSSKLLCEEGALAGQREDLALAGGEQRD